jgi:hypothetical protein
LSGVEAGEAWKSKNETNTKIVTGLIIVLIILVFLQKYL